MISRNARIAWLLLAPAAVLLAPAAVLLVAFTFYPTVATLIDSVHSTPRGRRPAEWVGTGHFQTMVADPIFRQAFVNNLINAVIEAFRLVDHVIALTRGGPNNSTQLLLHYIYQVAFSYWDTGYAAALSVALLAVLALIALVQFGFLDRRIHYR